ncbi:MAG TPA: prepilin-type N-terminal cleavage/methylation domain-containing protein [Thermoanaerobaculia bacterium]|nr:prepilin-type N-terminal cleavage/methylation domain-containing protein [Thermoanaerobaculia bacterium]
MVSVQGRQDERGFTLIELLIVVTIIGILAGIAVVNVKYAQRKAAETVLRADLTNLRKAIDDFYADKQRYPQSLQELVDAHYMRRIPIDPITKKADTWVEVREDADPDTGSPGGGFGGGSSTNPSLDVPTGPGVADVKSGATGETFSDHIAYGEL